MYKWSCLLKSKWKKFWCLIWTKPWFIRHLTSHKNMTFRPRYFTVIIKISFNGKNTKVYTVKRFGLDAFLFEMSQLFEIIVFTASQKQYADKVVAEIDPKKRISYVLNRDHCIIINKAYYLKNLKIMGRDLKQMILVDVRVYLIAGQ